MTSDRRIPVAFAAALAALMTASVGLQVVRDRLPVERRDVQRLLYVRSDSILKRLTVAFQTLAADVYWIRTIQHYGGDRLAKGGGAKYELLYPLLDITTTLDPRFTIAYRFGAIFLAEAWPGGPQRPDLSIALLTKGMKAEPRKWQYVMDIGFVHYWQLGDVATAAQWFKRASEIPGAPNWLRPLAGTILVQGGDRASSRFLWQQLRDSADQEWLRVLAERRLVQLQALDVADRIQEVATRYASQTDPPYSWERLVRAGAMPGVPLDPAGAPYALGPWSAVVRVAPQSPLQPMPTEPPAITER
jgi:hypothetical protein